MARLAVVDPLCTILEDNVGIVLVVANTLGAAAIGTTLRVRLRVGAIALLRLALDRALVALAHHTRLPTAQWPSLAVRSLQAIDDARS